MDTQGGTIIISDSNFTVNTAGESSGVVSTDDGTIIITDSNFTGNTAGDYGGAMTPGGSTTNITHGNFTGNAAGMDGGVMYSYGVIICISDSNFTGNTADDYGGVIHIFGDSLSIIVNSIFGLNEANNTGVIYSTHCNMVFYRNFGSLYTFNGNLTFGGYTNFENCAEPSHKSASGFDNINQEGGAITSFQSTVTFTGVSKLLSNQANMVRQQ